MNYKKETKPFYDAVEGRRRIFHKSMFLSPQNGSQGSVLLLINDGGRMRKYRKQI